jgi:hypothetical protein
VYWYRRDGVGMNHPGYGFRRPREFPAYPGTPFTSFTVLSAGATEVTPLVPGYGSGGEGATFSRAEHAVLYTNGTMQRYSLRLHFY